MRVSCLMVTMPVPDRLPMLRRAIDAYLRQSHADRELIVVVDRGAPAARRAVAELVAAPGRPDIRLRLAPAGLTLGALRNLSIASARGELLCQWDDDDLHHPHRIAAQAAALAASGRDAGILEDVLLYREHERTLRWTNWARTPAGGHPATLLCRRQAAPIYPEHGPEAVRGEDLAALLPLAAAGALHRLAGAAHLYVYVTHGANTTDAAHHDRLARTLAISRGLLRRREAMLRAGVAAFDLGPGPVCVADADGAAFSL